MIDADRSIGGGQLETSSARDRGERLYPPRSSRVYWHLTCLRRELEAVIRDFVPERGQATLIDYGCGNMPYRPLFEGRIGQYIGCDFPGNEEADRIITDASRLPFEDAVADLIISTQVLEHAAEPVGYLAECRRVLKAGGYLILSTHGNWHYHPDPHDYWRWTSEGLRKILTEAGLEIVRFRGIMGPASTALQLWQDATLPRLHWRLEGLFAAIMQNVIRCADGKCPNDLRDRDACVYVTVSKVNEE